MDYEKEYKAALERCREFYAKLGNKQLKEEVEDIFPELAESEDEGIRKSIIAIINNYVDNSNTFKTKMLAWLEKKGGQTDNLTQQEAMDIAVAKCFNEQKTADKIEPKFKVGDWVVVDGVTQQVTRIQPNGFDTDRAWNGKLTFKDVHLWTIQDAKDGDVLAAKTTIGYPNPFIAIYKEHGLNFFNSHCFVSWDGEFHEGTTGHSISDIHPATKEQCDFLFQKMKEAGYEWDDEKKELKKIEQKPADNIESSTFKDKLLELFQRFRWYCKDKTPTNGEILEYVDAHIQELIGTMQNTWSEEDERNLNDAILFIETGTYSLDKDNLINWLKSLKERVE